MMSKYLSLLLILFHLILWSQEPGIKNMTTIDGLPSDEVYKSLIDKEGYLWFATNSGVCYYDGQDFTTLDMSDGLIENTILEIEEDDEGRIWFSGLSGSLCYYEKGKLFPFIYNDIIQKNKDQVEIIGSGCLQVLSTTEIKALLSRGRQLHIRNGNVEIKDVSKGDKIELTKQFNKHKLFVSVNQLTQNIQFDVVFSDSTIITAPYKMPDFWPSIINYNLVQEFDDKLLFFTRTNAFVFTKNGEFQRFPLDFTPVFSLKGIYGGIWIGTENQGIKFYDDFDFRKKAKIQFLEGKYITSLRYDQNKRGWITTLTNGIYYVQSIYVTNYHQLHQDDNHVIKILRLNDGKIVGFTHLGSILLLDKDYKTLSNYNIGGIYGKLVYNAKVFGDDIYISTSSSFYKLPQSYFDRKIKKKPKVESYPIKNIKDFIIQDSIIWAATSTGLIYLPDLIKDGKANYKRLEGNKKSRITKIIAYTPKDGNSIFSYLIYQDLNFLWRLRYLKNDPTYAEYSVFQLDDNESDLFTAVNDIYVNNDIIFLGTKGRGLICLSKDSIRTIDKTNGLLSNFVKKIGFDNKGNMLLGTNKGIHVVSFVDTSFYEIDSIKYLTRNDGLIGNDIHDFIHFDQHILCGTNKGMSLINVPIVTSMTDEFPIRINEFKVNGKNIIEEGKESYKLNAAQNNLSISFDALDFHNKEGIEYYYKLLGAGAEEWKIIKEPSVVFPLMSPGSYSFEVKAKNAYGFWSSGSESISFVIPKVFYRTWFFRIVLISIVISLLFFTFKFYYIKQNQLLQTEKKVAEYQQQSLTRVINPHFLMNVFNSISSNFYIKKPEIAMQYITDIGAMVKHLFNSSYQNNISIAEEASLLQAYINIEKRRSNSRFNTIIKFNPVIGDLLIPSFMTQIFVENSILHGFSDLKERGGLITINFKKHEDFVRCRIVDNGMGMKASAEIEEDKATKATKARKHGVDIIKERIELLNSQQETKKYSLKIEEKKNSEGIVLGVVVDLKIPYYIASKIEEKQTNINIKEEKNEKAG